MKDRYIRRYVHEKLKNRWTPEQIAKRISMDYPNLKTNYESIYRYIYSVGKELIQYLPRHHRIRRKRGKESKKHEGKISNRVSIEDRPEFVNLRIRVGDFEIDTLGSQKSKSCLQVIVDRVTRYTWINLLNDKSAHEMMEKAIATLKQLDPAFRKTITFDNGTENAAHMRLKDELDIDTYFCHTYSSWEKGTVENTIGIIRRIFPKSTNFSLISIKQVKELEEWLNNRPRKCLNFMTPLEVMKLCTS
ncbi:IS30 family transposase ISCARN114 [Methanolapillus ohkumae]|uniref:IS30 family transposase ISCARN114 n=1 Tax=Methanolapillus ohkumae TaxID=3028298 RepID=A0AA96VFM4_9EURY|nr:IS30 family transposase ISCARN114 [Methanosarcinaceae archaeon Am2]WNY26633.1 IS30 family transposase ISCARN114 [Methanosarcinaceae archaeon Am2]WNY27192.1 IS30 family transposase ISCARN114 [Methanosarcinaceae archaeon Am2]WNY27512.1 IS30 family transposase ISCARN114 [Methanosarcinaceae archaeon Am2]WNY27541.1 IS30 family transposase ISCARN114 [Methanosarcinaceae archaeon Am2]